MRKTVRGLLALGLLLTFGLISFAQDDEMVDNPKYTFWAKFKPGATASLREVTKYSGPEKENYPGGVDEKIVTYRLVNVNKDRAVVLTTVTEEEFLGTVESAPTRLTYPAKVKKANLEAVMKEFGVKGAKDESVMVGKEEIKCKVLAGTYKKGGATVDYKFYYSDAVPGGIVKRTRSTKADDKMVADTTITLKSFSLEQMKKKPKD